MRQIGEIKRGPRVGTDLKAVMRRSNGEEIHAVITDISKDGFRLLAEGQLFIGERLEVQLPKTGEVPAQIRWALGNEAGGIFLAPLPLRALR